MKWIDRFFCRLRGHDDIAKFEADRMLLVCTTCGRESPGWEVAKGRLGPKPPTAVKASLLVHSERTG